MARARYDENDDDDSHREIGKAERLLVECSDSLVLCLWVLIKKDNEKLINTKSADYL
jgi:hypothetical protein